MYFLYHFYFTIEVIYPFSFNLALLISFEFNHNFNFIWIQFTFWILNFINYLSFTTDSYHYFKLVSFTNSLYIPIHFFLISTFLSLVHFELNLQLHFISHNSNWFSIFSFILLFIPEFIFSFTLFNTIQIQF